MAIKVVPGSSPMSAITVEGGDRRWTPLAVKRTLERAGKWTDVKTALVAADRYDDFLMASFISEADEEFAEVKAWAVEQYGSEAVEALLDQIPEEG